MWIAKPVYESLPYFYLTAGILSLASALYLNYGYWPGVAFVTGLACLVIGVVVLLKRRDARLGSRRKGPPEPPRYR